ncbi:phosphotransferase [Candidatus Uhrbacteria bacterium]|nr:phosphotransferase [Candidatus Uhrbacteria bacterium]
MANPFEQFVSFESAAQKKTRRETPPSPEHAALRTRIEREILAFKRQDLLVDSGEVADVYHGDPSEQMESYVIKHKARTREKSVYENDMETEMERQTDAYLIVQHARERGVAVADVPKPFAYIRTHDRQEFIAMERAPGKTLYRHLLDRLAAAMPDDHLLPGVKREDLPHLTDADLEEMALNRFLNAKGKSRAQLYQAIFSKVEPFLPPTTALAVRNTVKELNANKFFHRDLHEKNLMLSDDLTHASIIDFGSASVGEFDSLADACETEVLGTKVRYAYDTGIVGTLAKVVKKP